MATIADSDQAAHVSEHNSTKNMLSWCPGSVSLPVVDLSDTSSGLDRNLGVLNH